MRITFFSEGSTDYVRFDKDGGLQSTYKLLNGKMPLSHKQFNMPNNSKMVFEDGGMLIHYGEFGLLRNYIKPNGEKVDRVAFWWGKAIDVQNTDIMMMDYIGLQQ